MNANVHSIAPVQMMIGGMPILRLFDDPSNKLSASLLAAVVTATG